MEQKRNYKNEASRQKELNKMYRVKIPINTSKTFEEKLKKNNKTASEILRKAVNRYIEDN